MIPFVPVALGAHIKAGFFGRQGGISDGLFNSLNVGFQKGDPPENVSENRRRIVHTLTQQSRSLVTLNQVHGVEVVLVTSNADLSQTPGDAMISQTPGVVLGIQTADCVPILLADQKNGWIGAIHAGWRSAQAGIVAKTVQCLEDQGVLRQNLKAAIGPCIWAESYEVRQDVGQYFPENYLTPSGPDQFYLNLPAFVQDQLENLGVETVPSPENTYTQTERYFSCRRSFHEGAPVFGTQLSAISLA